jgi:hypothetical protein
LIGHDPQPDPASLPKQAYVAPRLLRVQRRSEGDNLSSGCKNVGMSGPLSSDCGATGTACNDTNGS